MKRAPSFGRKWTFWRRLPFHPERVYTHTITPDKSRLLQCALRHINTAGIEMDEQKTPLVFIECTSIGFPLSNTRDVALR